MILYELCMILFLWFIVLIILFLCSLKSREGFSGGVQFIRIVNATQPVSNFIQIGEVLAFDKNGENVALGKQVTTSGEWPGWTPANAVNNNLNSAFHSANPPRASDFWEVDLGKEYNLERIEYFNRADCCQERIIGCTMILMNRKKVEVEKFQFKSNEMKQTFLISAEKNLKEAHPAVRDRTRWI